jgi:hypothetical protein
MFLLVLVGLMAMSRGEAEQLIAAVTPLVPVPQYAVKAAYLLRFTRYVEWPEATFRSPEDPLVIGVLGDNPFGDVLERTVEGQTTNHRPIEVRVVQDVEEAARCQLVFIARGQPQQGMWLQALQKRPVLTVTESAQGLAEGAVLALVLDAGPRGQRVSFQASLIAAQQAKLKISASMLASASMVVRPPSKEKEGM